MNFVEFLLCLVMQHFSKHLLRFFTINKGKVCLGWHIRQTIKVPQQAYRTEGRLVLLVGYTSNRQKRRKLYITLITRMQYFYLKCLESTFWYLLFFQNKSLRSFGSMYIMSGSQPGDWDKINLKGRKINGLGKKTKIFYQIVQISLILSDGSSIFWGKCLLAGTAHN